MPGCYDALSAAIVQKSGFSAGFISGYALSASLHGKPDFGLLTPPEMAATARTVCAAAPMIPIIADADTGGGNALNVQRTIKDLIAAGAAGCFLEDQAWPKKCGHMRGKQVLIGILDWFYRINSTIFLRVASFLVETSSWWCRFCKISWIVIYNHLLSTNFSKNL